MPLQNRVTPFGEIIAVEARGTIMGNRGILHDDNRHIVRSWQVRRWLACQIEFRGRHRIVMRPHRYTELFFLDEATAFAAGHRPCAECRHADYQHFRELWIRCHGEPVSADIIDRRLHDDRLLKRDKRVYRERINALPDGAHVRIGGRAWLVWSDCLLAWSPSGYTERQSRPRSGEVEVLTPKSIVAILAAGYRAAVHPSAQGDEALPHAN